MTTPFERLQVLMERYDVPSKGKTICGHFSPAEAVELLELAESRVLTVSEIISTATMIGLPLVKKELPVVRPENRNGPRHTRRVFKITPALRKRMLKFNVPNRGLTLSGHFGPEQAIEVMQTAETRNRSRGSIVKRSVELGLPEVKLRFRPSRQPATA